MCQLSYKTIKINDDMKKKRWNVSYEIYYGVPSKKKKKKKTMELP